jgi:hypothetical protein
MRKICERGGRRHFSAAERAYWVKEFTGSGLTQREFALQHQDEFSCSTLQRWVAEESRGAAPLWQELKLGSAGNGPRWAAELVRGDGVVVRLAHDVPEGLLQRVLAERC